MPARPEHERRDQEDPPERQGRGRAQRVLGRADRVRALERGDDHEPERDARHQRTEQIPQHQPLRIRHQHHHRRRGDERRVQGRRQREQDDLVHGARPAARRLQSPGAAPGAMCRCGPPPRPRWERVSIALASSGVRPGSEARCRSPGAGMVAYVAGENVVVRGSRGLMPASEPSSGLSCPRDQPTVLQPCLRGSHRPQSASDSRGSITWVIAFAASSPSAFARADAAGRSRRRGRCLAAVRGISG